MGPIGNNRPVFLSEIRAEMNGLIKQLPPVAEEFAIEVFGRRGILTIVDKAEVIVRVDAYDPDGITLRMDSDMAEMLGTRLLQLAIRAREHYR